MIENSKRKRLLFISIHLLAIFKNIYILQGYQGFQYYIFNILLLLYYIFPRYIEIFARISILYVYIYICIYNVSDIILKNSKIFPENWLTKFFARLDTRRLAGLGLFPLAVREACICRHSWGSIEGPPSTPRYHNLHDF